MWRAWKTWIHFPWLGSDEVEPSMAVAIYTSWLHWFVSAHRYSLDNHQPPCSRRRTTLHLAFGYLAFYIVRSMPTPYGFFPYPCFATYDQHLGALEGGWYYKTFTRILQTPNMRSFTVYIKAHCQMGINQTHPTHKMYPRGPKLARSSRTLADLP